MVDKSQNGIIGIELKSKLTAKCILVCSCYLPPEGSPWADTSSFYGHLISQSYLNSYADNVFVAGDFNVRNGNRLDFIERMDLHNKCHVLDKTINSYCDSFLEFIKDIKMCIVNGRVTPEFDNFTCFNRNGCSIVDYIITDYDSLNKCKKCKVFSVNEIINENNKLESMISSSCKVPDHSVIMVEFEYVCQVKDHHESSTQCGSIYRKYSFQNLNDNFLNNDNVK